MRYLHHLNVSSNHLKVLPDEFCDIEYGLVEFFCANNELQELPENFHKFHRLEVRHSNYITLLLFCVLFS